MSAETNLVQFNPTAANQEQDSTYQSDSLVTGGAISGPWPPQSANKTLYQLTTFMASFAQMMQAKGYSLLDGTTPIQAYTTSNAAVIAMAAALANVLTNQDRPFAIKALNTVTLTGTALQTAYTIAIPAGFMGLTNQLRITLAMEINSAAGSPGVVIFYGGSRISPPAAIPTAQSNTSASMVIVGGNLSSTTSQSWDYVASNLFFPTGSLGNQGHQNTAVNSAVAQNLTVTFQGGVSGDSVTFYKCLVELL